MESDINKTENCKENLSIKSHLTAKLKSWMETLTWHALPNIARTEFMFIRIITIIFFLLSGPYRCLSSLIKNLIKF